MIWFGIAWGGVEIAPSPQLGQESVVTMTLGDRAARGETVRVVHRAGTTRAHERAIGITDARGRTSWTPQAAGVFELRAGDFVQRGRVPWPSPPLDSMVLLVALLFSAVAAAGFGLRRRSRKRT